MAKGFVYVMTTVTREYEQQDFCNVPTQWGDRLYFGPCKVPMRPRLAPEHIVVGLSSSKTTPRRAVFTTEIDEKMTFREAHRRFPGLRGPRGPIHVEPIESNGVFPESQYAHIRGSIHETRWRLDLATAELDAFFVGKRVRDWRNRWLGKVGPIVNEQVVSLLNQFPIFGIQGRLGLNEGTTETPIRHGDMYSGLHVELDPVEPLLALFEEAMKHTELPLLGDTPRLRLKSASECGCGRH